MPTDAKITTLWNNSSVDERVSLLRKAGGTGEDKIPDYAKLEFTALPVEVQDYVTSIPKKRLEEYPKYSDIAKAADEANK